MTSLPLLPGISGNRSGVQKDISINISVTVEVKKIGKPPFVLIVNIIRKTRFLTFLSCLSLRVCLWKYFSTTFYFRLQYLYLELN
jgi:hypothetical protein